ncbi:hypothetical protein EDB19DRAFT_1863305 [Suillus lakei]|nr:hypothetical protein EDB19DRAFT_1863305 [Suillus lakei]
MSPTPGTRTPRRVQWANTDHVHEPEPVSPHALDEMAKDPNAFETLKDALERHQSSRTHSPTGSPSHVIPPTLEVHTYPPSTPSSSVPTSPTPSTPFLPHRTHALPGEVFIDPLESAGLPLSSRQPSGDSEMPADGHGHVEHFAVREAAGVVRAHTKRWGIIGRRHRSKSRSRSRMPEPEPDSEKENRNTGDKEEEKHHPTPEQPPKKSWWHFHTPPSVAPTPHHPPPYAQMRAPYDPESHPPLHASQPKLGSGVTTSLLSSLKPKPTGSSMAALITGAGTLGGAAAPQQLGLAPDLKKRGYGLVRYRLEDVAVVDKGGTGDGEEEGEGEGTVGRKPTPPRLSLRLPRRSKSTDFDFTGGVGGKRWKGVLKDLPLPHHLPTGHFKGFSLSERERKERKEREKERRRKRKRAEVYITRHVAAILQRQEFILKLARAMMMFGGPSHRLVAQIQSTARVLELELSCMYLPDVMWISFEDNATGTSNVKFIRQGSALDLGKLGEAHGLYWDVIHDVISVSSASAALDTLMRKKPIYSFPQLIFLGGMCSSSICSVSFNGSFLDCLASFPLGALLVTIQLLSVRNELYGNVFEITVATLLSFISAALASTERFCYEAVASSSVVLILPGFIVLNGSLEISSRSLIAGSVRLCYALMYSLFLGFGLAIGAELYQTMLGKPLMGGTDSTCLSSHDPEGGWWQRTPSLWWAFLSVPCYSLFLSLRFGAVLRRRELLLLVAISCIGWVTNHFVGTKFPNQSDISAAVGAFAVGFVSNLYGRFFEGNAFVVMITGILFQLPSGLGNGGLFNFVVDQTSGSSSSYQSGFNTALQLISTSVGLTVGLGISLVLVHPIQSRRRAAGMFSL